MSAIITAIEHVRESHPEVTMVYFDSHQRWYYTNAEGATPKFSESVDYDTLEAALDEAWEGKIPVAFELHPVTHTLRQVKPVDDIEELHNHAT